MVTTTKKNKNKIHSFYAVAAQKLIWSIIFMNKL